MPVSDSAVTSDSVLKVTYGAPPPADNGSPIVSYELQMDDGLGGDFVTLTGFSPSSMIRHFTVSQGVVKGRDHRFRYRVRNAVGWGEYSEESFVLAAVVPSAPFQPIFSSFSAGTLFVEVGVSEDNGGTAILDYELWRDEGDDFSSAFSKVSNFDGQALIDDLTVADDGMVAGRTYRF